METDGSRSPVWNNAPGVRVRQYVKIPFTKPTDGSVIIKKEKREGNEQTDFKDQRAACVGAGSAERFSADCSKRGSGGF